MTLEITVTGSALDRLGDLRARLADDAVKAAAGGGVRRLLQDHFRALDQARANQLGGRRTHFYAAAARSITYATDGAGVTVSIHAPGIALHYYGGTVKPVNGSRYLTIPVDPDAYGRRAREFNHLSVQYGRTRDGGLRPMFLVQDTHTTYKVTKGRKTGKVKVHEKLQAGKIMYYLALSATIRPDPSVLPTDETINQAARASILSYLGR